MKPRITAPADRALATASTISVVVPVTEEMMTIVPSPTRRSPVAQYSAALRAKTSRAVRSFMWQRAWRQLAQVPPMPSQQRLRNVPPFQKPSTTASILPRRASAPRRLSICFCSSNLIKGYLPAQPTFSIW